MVVISCRALILLQTQTTEVLFTAAFNGSALFGGVVGRVGEDLAAAWRLQVQNTFKDQAT